MVKRLLSWLWSCRPLLAAVIAAVLTLGSVPVGAASAVASGPTLVPLVTFYNPVLGDYFTTSQSNWTCKYFHTCTSLPDPNYQIVGIQGHAYNPDNPRPANTAPLYHWWSYARGDNFLTTDPVWAGTVGDRRDLGGGVDYVLYRIEGYMSTVWPTGGGITLYSYWNPTVGDNAAIATWRFAPAAGYGNYRRETGYLLPPESASLLKCLTAPDTPNYRDEPAWHALGNYVNTWNAPAGLLDGDALRVDASGVVRIDYWGHEESVIGYSWSHAGANFPAPGEPPYSLVGTMTAGATYVVGRGWYEPNTWFPVVGTMDTGTPTPSPCLLYESTGISGGQLRLGINDGNISDNGGYAVVNVNQWW